MKKISLILAFILATTLIVSLCACAPSKADKLVITTGQTTFTTPTWKILLSFTWNKRDAR